MSLNLGNRVDLIDPFMENCLIKIDLDTLYDLVFHEFYDNRYDHWSNRKYLIKI